MQENVTRVLMATAKERDVARTRELFRIVADQKYKLDWCPDFNTAKMMVARRQHDVILADEALHGQPVGELLAYAKLHALRVPIIVLQKNPDLTTAKVLKQDGAADVLNRARVDAEVLGRTIRFVIDRLRTAHALRRRNEAYNAATAFSRDIIFETRGSVFTSLNPAWEHETGFVVADSIGRNLVDFVESTERSIVINLCSSNNKPTEDHCNCQLNIRTRRGKKLPVTLRASYIKNEAGNVTGLVGSMLVEQTAHYDEQDFQPTKIIPPHLLPNSRIPSKIKPEPSKNGHDPQNNQVELRFRSVVDSLGDGVIISTQGQRLILYSNRRALRMLQSTRKDVLGKSLTDLLVGAEKISQPTADRPSSYECQMRRDDGQLVWVDVRDTILKNADKKPIGILSVMVDISERKQEEVQRTLLLGELEEAVRTKDEFLASVSHEVRTPLNLILGKVEVLKEEIHGPLTSNQSSSLNDIEDSANHLLALINDILDLSKMESGLVKLDKKAVAIPRIVKYALAKVSDAASLKRMRLSKSIDANADVMIADEDRLRQVLENLLSNAIKFTPSEGEIAINVEASHAEKMVYFHIHDNGIGIASDDIDRMFRRFEQADSSLTRPESGAGLGLALVQHLVELHGGEVQVDSTVGKGSCFTVAIPWVKEAQAQMPTRDKSLENGAVHLNGAAKSAELAPSAPPKRRKMHTPPMILIAEDNEMNITMLTDYLEVKGFDIRVARNGLEAVDMSRELEPDLVIMDMQMPQLDGLEATRIIRQDESLSWMPIIGLTALVMPGDRERCLEAGANEYMSKPVSLRELVNRIQQQLRLSQKVM